ncbi:MAG: Hpt domain-containing protein [Gammaproteobacteria bacterium]
MTHADTALRSQLAALKERYRASLPGKRAEIDTLVQGCRDSHWSNEDAVAALRESVHRLAGSGGSYGFDNLSDAGAYLEAQIRGVMEGNGSWAVEKAYIEFSRVLERMLHAVGIEETTADDIPAGVEARGETGVEDGDRTVQ